MKIRTLLIAGLLVGLCGCIRDSELDTARKAAEQVVAQRLSVFDKTEIISSVAIKQSEDDKKDAMFRGDWASAQADVIVLVQVRLGGFRKTATVSCARTATPGIWGVSVTSVIP